MRDAVLLRELSVTEMETDPQRFRGFEQSLVAGAGISRSKKLLISASSSIHQRGKKLVSANSGKTTRSLPRALASRINASSRETTCCRDSSRAIGPS